MKRVELLDYLRGIMALSVMLYHYTLWTEIDLFYPLDQMISRLGIYAVSAFYVLSGASLAIVYSNKQVNNNFIKDFTIKRVFRIAPLFYTVTILAILLNVISGTDRPDFQTLLLNFTLLFGWLSPGSYIATGAWSIGNELVFYSILPLMLFLKNKALKYYVGFFAITIIISGYFSFTMDKHIPFANQWLTYINPLNQLYLFAGGFLIGVLLKRDLKVPKVILMSTLIISILIFIFLPVEGGSAALVIGIPKIMFSLTIFGLCLFAAFWGDVKINPITTILKYLGDTSYSIYLMHAIVYYSMDAVLSKLTFFDTKILLVLFSIIGTLVVSSISYYFIERRFMKLGKQISKRNVSNKNIATGVA